MTAFPGATAPKSRRASPTNSSPRWTLRCAVWARSTPGSATTRSSRRRFFRRPKGWRRRWTAFWSTDSTYNRVMPDNDVPRRTFLRGVTAATALSYSRVYGANERVQLGLIGCGERAAQSSVHRVFLDADDAASLGSGGRKGIGVEGFDRVDAQDAAEDALAGEDIGGLEGLTKDSSSGCKCYVRSFANRSDAARPESFVALRSGRRVRFVQAQIGRTAMRDQIAGRFGRSEEHTSEL